MGSNLFWIAISAVILISIALIYFFISYILPYYREYIYKCELLDSVNREYENIRKVREDVVFHYHWANERGDFKEAGNHEAYVLELDEKLKHLTSTYNQVALGSYRQSIRARENAEN
eukprot:GHVL01042315.1.p1 GENE.GHVL01042315.1~~GHVL01042315.1.p1  ORF type:complete len:117 (+),score=23.86 GHVL01042315.1:19-369(+)